MKLIDTHIHGAFGVNFNTSCKDEIKLALKKLYERNIVAICPTLVGDTPQKIHERLKLFKKIKHESTVGLSHIIGVHLEGTFINPKKPGIQDPNVFMTPNVKNFKELVKNEEDIVKIVTLAPELDCGGEFTKYLESKNIRAHAGHTVGCSIGNATGTTHHFNAMPAISHRGKNIALDSLFDDEIYCEIIADKVHVEENMLKLFFKIKNPNKIIFVSDALPAAHCDKSIIFCGKEIFSNGKDIKGTLAGSVKLLDEITENLLKTGMVSKKQIEAGAFENVIKHLKLTSDEIIKLA